MGIRSHDTLFSDRAAARSPLFSESATLCRRDRARAI